MKFAENYLAWALFALLALSLCGTYREGTDLARVSELN
jgi:hypothetical protein